MRLTTQMNSTLPKNYQLVLDLIEASGGGAHLTAYDLFARARERAPKIGMATVHRALGALHDRGLVSKVLIAGMDSATYEPIAEQHAHFRCRRCGNIEDVAFALPKRVMNALSARIGFRVAEEHVTLAGACAACVRSEGRHRRRARDANASPRSR